MSALTLTVSTSSSDEQPAVRRHARHWLDDGSLVVRAQDDLYTLPRTLLQPRSAVLAALEPSSSEDGRGLVVLHIPDALEVSSADFEALLGSPATHSLARTRREDAAPGEKAEEALALAVKHDVPSIRKALYYSIATHSHDHDADDPSPGTDAPKPRAPLAPELIARCDALLGELIAHFTPVLFTVATAGHMACTDVFAERWMPLVIQRALDENGLCRPLETLQEIIEIDWAKEGLCEECVAEKREEWRAEQREVWTRMDGWLS